MHERSTKSSQIHPKISAAKPENRLVKRREIRNSDKTVRSSRCFEDTGNFDFAHATAEDLGVSKQKVQKAVV